MAHMIRYYLANFAHLLFYGYTLLIFGRIILTWIPSWQNHVLVRFISFLTDPYLKIFQRVLPPLGGVLDISPIIAFFCLRIAESIVLRMILL